MYITRANETIIYRSFSGTYITALLGPRRVGKSTLVKQYAEQHNLRAWVFLNMDNREQRLKIVDAGLKTLIQENAQLQIGSGEKLWVAIDEAQKCPALFDQIKLLYDNYKDQNAIKFILTGSGFLTLHQLSAESLAGRIELYYLREFNLIETIQLHHQKEMPAESLLDIACDKNDLTLLQRYIEGRAPLRPLAINALQEQLLYGGLPEVLKSETGHMRTNYLSNYIQTYLEKDIRALITISDLNLYQKLLDITAEQTGSIRQDKEITEALGCSRDTLKKYRGYLLATLVYKEIYPFIGHSLKRIVKSPKGYLLNNGLISYLTGINTLNVLEKAGLIGYRFENWFLKELQIWLDRDTRRSEIYFWRTTGGMEVDFVVEKKPHIFPFEVTYSSRILDKKVKNILSFMRAEPRAKAGFYIYTGDFHYDGQNKIYFIPAWAIS